MLQTISGKGGKTRISSVVSLVSRGNLGLFLQAHQVPLQSGRHCQGCLSFGNFISCGLISCLHVPIFVLFFYYQFFPKNLSVLSPPIIVPSQQNVWELHLLPYLFPNSATEGTAVVNTTLLYVMINLFWYECVLNLSSARRELTFGNTAL